MWPFKRSVLIQLGLQNDTAWFCFSLADTSKLKHFVQSEPCVCRLHRGGSANFFYKGPDGDYFRLYGRNSVTTTQFCLCAESSWRWYIKDECDRVPTKFHQLTQNSVELSHIIQCYSLFNFFFLVFENVRIIFGSWALQKQSPDWARGPVGRDLGWSMPAAAAIAKSHETWGRDWGRGG